MKEDKIKLVFEGPSVKADYVNNTLESSGIRTFVKNKLMGQMFPLYASTAGINPVKIFVSPNDYGKSVKLIENLTGNEEI